jgi:peptide/nickel transport system substrate-binding protein
MKNLVRSIAVLAVLAIVAVACGGNNGGTTATGSPSASGTIPTGGTLKLALVNDVDAAFDPQRAYYQINFEFEKCCLGRTLYSTNGLPVDQGGSDLKPDIASAMPKVSSDGLTWTISLKSGIKYSPPFQNTEVTAGDFIRAMMREADPKVTAAYSFYYTAIAGFSDFSSGKADTISGMTALDDHTLQIKVTEPTGDLGWRLAMPAAAPIPPSGNAQYGAAQGHEKDWGRFQVSTGPYMFQGEDQIDFSKPADQQQPAAGYVPGRQIVLVRNPSWDASTDDLRPAYVDQITAPIGGDVADLYNKVESGEIDEVFDAAPPADVLQKYSTNPDLQDQLHVYPQNAVYYASMNMAVPPFDDIHVRKAMNLVLDKAGARQLGGGPLVGVNAGHIFPDGLTNNLEKSYDPYATPDDSGSASLAQAEMKQSKYDTNGDGKCDAAVCQNIIAITNTTAPAPRIAALFNQNVGEIGMSFDIKAFETSTMYAKCNQLTARYPICLAAGWIQDYPDAYTFGPPLFGGPNAPGGGALYPSCCNYSNTGNTPQQLKKWGYSVTSVPSVDDKLNACAALAVGDQRTQCWVDLDKYLMENVVPWVPRTFSNSTEITGTRVVNYSYDEFGGIMALDHVAVSG